MSREDANLRTQMLYAIRDKDRKRGEILRTKMLEKAAESYLREIRLINDAFYSAWHDLEAGSEIKKARESTCVAEHFCDEMIQNIKHNVSAAKKRIEIVVAIRRAAMKIEDASRSNDTMRCPAVEIMQRIITEEISESTGLSS